MSEKIKARNIWKIVYRAMCLKSVLMIVFMFAFSICEIYINKEMNLFPSEMITSITNNDWDSIEDSLWVYLGFVIAITLAISLKLWFADLLAVEFRKKLVDQIQNEYLKDNSFNELLLRDSYVDNPDARITQDVQNWATSLSIILKQIIQIPFQIVLYTVYIGIDMDFLTILYCYLFALITMVVSFLIMKPVSKLTFTFSKNDGDFRLAHVNLKENAEVVALSHGQPVESELIANRLGKVLNTQRLLANWSFSLNFTSNFFLYIGGAMEYVFILLYVMKVGYDNVDVYTFIQLVGFKIISLINGLTTILNVLVEISQLNGYTSRIYELWEILKQYQNDVFQGPFSEDSIQIDHVTVTRPAGEVLINDLTCKFEHGKSVFITGPSGSGKSSIFRVIAHVWPTTTGTIIGPRPVTEQIMIFTQVPYLPVASLSECVVFPASPEDYNTESIDEVLEFLEISYLKERRGENWQSGLSPGERQRVALTRLFIHRPMFALLDEATSAIPQRLEEKIFERIQELGITTVTIAHNLKIKKFHQFCLNVDGYGGYTFEPIQE